MTRKKLEELLASGSITQAEFDDMVKNVEEPAPENEPANDPEPAPAAEPAKESIDYDKIDKILQSRLDKAMAEERKKNADLKKQVERLQREKMTDDELKQVEMEEKERTIAERERAIAEKENRLYAVKAIKEAGLDDGSDISLSLIDFVMGADESEIDGKVRAFKELFDKKVSAEVSKRFKDGGYTPKKSENLNNGVNPYSTEQWNLTAQMQLEQSNPELAKQLQAAAASIKK